MRTTRSEENRVEGDRAVLREADAEILLPLIAAGSMALWSSGSTTAEPPTRLRSDPQAIRSSWDDLLEGVKTPEDWRRRKAILRERYLDLIRDRFKRVREMQATGIRIGRQTELLHCRPSIIDRRAQLGVTRQPGLVSGGLSDRN